MKKVLFVIPTMRMGGAEKSLVNLLNSMNLEDKEIDLLLFEKDGELFDSIPSKVNVIEADFYTRAMLLEFRFYFKQLLKTKNIAAVIVRLMILINSKIQEHTNIKLFFNWNLAKKFVKKQDKSYDVSISYLEGAANYYVIDKVMAKKKIGWVHTDISIQKRNFQKEKAYYQQLDTIVTVSEKCREQFVQCYPDLNSKVTMIENFSSREIVVKKAKEPVPDGFERGNFCIVTVGRLESVKGIDIAFQAAKILRDRKCDFKWHIFGDGSLKTQIQDRIEKENMRDFFILEGITKNPYCYMRAADLIVQPSRYEGKSIVLDEAKILACPIVVTNYTSVRDQIEDGVTGIIVGISPEFVAEGIEKVIRNADLREDLKQNCKNISDRSKEILKDIERLCFD